MLVVFLPLPHSYWFLVMLRFTLTFFLILTSAATTAQPNIVFIFADDLGIGDVGAYGGEMIKTPHIDALAADGVLFEQAYASHPVCSPSRAGLITGRYQQRHGWEFNPAEKIVISGMDAKQITLANVLNDSGYATGMVGKWHLGYKPQFHPLNRGFDHYFGVLAGGSIFIDQSRPDVESIGNWPSKRDSSKGVYDGHKLIEVEDYLTDVFTNRAVDFIKQKHQTPFFLYLGHTTPHTPLQATKKYTSRYQHITNPAARIYAAMVASLDDSVGAVVEALRETNQLDNTLIVFSSDNGCAGYIQVCSNAPFKGFKRHHNEGGIRVPLIFSWPGQLVAGNYPHMVSLLDLMATFAGLAGSFHATEDSVDLMPYLAGKAGQPHDYLYWRSSPTRAIRDQRWKLLEYAKTQYSTADLDAARRIPPPPGGWPKLAPNGYLTLLYDLQSDPGETTNIAQEHP
ncbi:MAG: sulfatase-like hydrolase/transferase, partial [Proteobacteria bacterium]|nr:sulfatase-like hydrolase/transferase [Pseudomonadota bacterium]